MQLIEDKFSYAFPDWLFLVYFLNLVKLFSRGKGRLYESPTSSDWFIQKGVPFWLALSRLLPKPDKTVFPR